MPLKNAQNDPNTFEEAWDELTAINKTLETGVKDVDELYQLAERAKWLGDWCQERLSQVELKVQQLFGDHSVEAV